MPVPCAFRAGQWKYAHTLHLLFDILESEGPPYSERSMEGESAQILSGPLGPIWRGAPNSTRTKQCGISS